MPQQFVIPQFIETEAKIFLGMSARQFVQMVVGGLIIALAYRFADFSLFLIIAILDLTLTVLFTFAKINGQPFHYFLLNIIQTFRRSRLRVWDKTLNKSELKLLMKVEEEKLPEKLALKGPLGTSKLAELSLIVDTGGVYTGENTDNMDG